MLEILSSKKSLGGGLALGPGPQTTDKFFKRTDGKESGFFGTLAAAEVATANDLKALTGWTVATPTWMKFALDGKVLYIPTTTLVDGIARSTMYQKGLVYGRDDFGGYPDGANVLQNKKLVVNGYTYLVRLPRISLKDTYTAADMPESEWARLMWTVDRNTAASDTEAGTKWATINTGTPGHHCMTAQVPATATGNANCIGYESIKTPSSLGRTSANANVGWRPVLELIP
ncbi:hypothetical protein OGA59_004474 [Salmonella enterica]|nr:hypothetical protein [Salmonella enterica]EJY3320349.1 hypothetical protein [Salmonella enterica]